MSAQHQMTNSTTSPALPARLPYAPLRFPGMPLPKIPPPAPAGFKPELS
jgi:hypothetical protein